jgi:electron transfer flavoprotein beta subunit
MNILVVLRAGRDPASFTVNRKVQKVFVHRNEYRTNPADLNALEAALQLSNAGQTVIALAGGGPEAQEALYQARAMGAARAVWITDTALREADAGPRVAILQKAMTHLGGVDLVLLGASVRHADLAQTGPRLAAALGWPFIDAAHALQMEGATLTATVAAGAGFEGVRAGTPAVVAVAEDANQPRFAPAASIIRVYAEADAIEALTPADLGVDPADLQPQVVRRGERYPPERTFGQVLAGSTEDLARQMAAALRGGG